jgi:hypothetical protein
MGFNVTYLPFGTRNDGHVSIPEPREALLDGLERTFERARDYHALVSSEGKFRSQIARERSALLQSSLGQLRVRYLPVVCQYVSIRMSPTTLPSESNLSFTSGHLVSLSTSRLMYKGSTYYVEPLRGVQV